MKRFSTKLHGQELEANTLDGLSVAWREAIEDQGLGASDLMQRDGLIYEIGDLCGLLTKQRIGVLSYNGKVRFDHGYRPE